MLLESELIFAAEKAFSTIDTSSPGYYKIGFVNFDIVCLHVHTVSLGMVTVAEFTRAQLTNGLTGSQWFKLDAALRRIYRQLLKCQQPSQQSAQPSQLNSSTSSNTTQTDMLIPDPDLETS